MAGRIAALAWRCGQDGQPSLLPWVPRLPAIKRSAVPENSREREQTEHLPLAKSFANGSDELPFPEMVDWFARRSPRRPPHSPYPNAHLERFHRSLKAECLIS